MHDDKYCYPGSNVLINRLNIQNAKELFEAEKELTAIRLKVSPKQLSCIIANQIRNMKC